MALGDGRAVKEYQKASIQAKALGILHHRVILTTVRSSFSKDDTHTSSSSPCHILGTPEHKAFVCSQELIYDHFVKMSAGLLPLLFPIQQLDRMWRTFDTKLSRQIIYSRFFM